MTYSTKKGFTLIELLVVIAIIGILATVVLASLGTARGRANDAKVMAQVSNARAQAEMYAIGNGGSFAGVCDSVNGLNDIRVALPLGQACNDASGAWALSGLLSQSGTYFCADSTGATHKTAQSSSGTTVCPPLVP